MANWSLLRSAQKRQHGVVVRKYIVSYTGILSKYNLLQVYVVSAYWVKKL